MASHHQHFFVRKGHRFARANSCKCRAETGRANRSDDDEINVWMRGHFLHLRPADRNATTRTARHQVVGFAASVDEPRAKLADLFLEEGDVIPSRESDNVKSPRQ